MVHMLDGMQIKTFRGENLEQRVKQWLEENPHIREVGTDPFPTHDGEPAVAVFYNLKS